MANLPSKTFAQIVSDQVTAIQAGASFLLDFAVGSILRAMVEAYAAVVLWLQGLILTLLAITRAATSSGADLDSWCADFNFFRLPAVAASGNVTFSRYSTGLAAFIPVGTLIQTSDQTAEVFAVSIDTGNAYYSAALGGYTIPSGVGSIAVPVAAQIAGAAGNVLAGQCNVLTQSIPGVDTVQNAIAFTNGADAEADALFRARFINYIGSLSKATKGAIGAAITALQQGIQYTITENYSYAGASQPGYFYVVADDGTGTPSGGFLSSISNAIDAVRGFTITFGVYAPIVTTANVVMTATIAAGYDATATKALVQSAINAYIAGLGLGNSLSYTRLAQVSYDASPGVTNITSVTLNSATADVTADAKHTIKPGTITVN